MKTLIETETGERFNKEGYIKCPFHNEKSPSLSIKFFPDKNKDKFMCWGCKESGDSLDFIMKFRKLGYKEAREYLEMENKKSDRELQSEKVKDYIKWQIEKTDFKRGYKFLGLFPFVDVNNNVIYYKAKLLKTDGKKETPYYYIEENKVINKRGADEVPYNLHNVLDGIKNQKTIIFVEGEKDANKINSLLKGLDFVATSIKGCTDLSILKNGFKFKIHVISDTGKAGEQYKWHIHKEFNSLASSFKFINLPGLKALGNNKDVTDWLEYGNTKEDLLNAFNRSLDLKSEYDLQQNSRGIYKFYWDKKDELKKFYLTDFKLLEAKRMTFIDDESEGVKLVFKSSTGKTIEKIVSATVFDDVRSFKNSLGSLDLAFESSKSEDLTKLKSWINKYWAIENEELHSGVKFLERNDELMLVTKDGAITSNNVNYSLKTDKNNVEIIDKEFISKDELEQLKHKIFKFTTSDKSITIIGTILHDLTVYQNKEAKEKIHHLLMVGESGSGKSTILSNIIAAILNYPIKDIKSIGMITPFALVQNLSNGNYPSLFDEFKPSSLDKYKVQKLSENFRNLYDRTTISRGDKSFKTKDFQLTRPLILAGEESYPNAEKALIERSAIVYLSKRERTQEHTDAMQWLTKNENILNKFGRSIIDEILNLSVDNYKAIREDVRNLFPDLSNRPLTTAINIATGIEIFNILLERNGLAKLIGYEKHIMQNIKEEVLDGGTDAKSTVEQMLVLYNNMIEDGRAYNYKNVVIERGDGLFIRTSEMINEICVFVNQVGSAEVIPLKLRDFKKQATKSGYLVKTSAKQIKVESKAVWFDEYSKERIRDLKNFSICKSNELELEPMDNEERKVIEGVFNGA